MLTVVVAENDPAQAEAMRAPLDDRGYRVLPVSTGADVLRLVSAGEADLVVLGLALRDLAGDVALGLIRAVSAVPVIVTTDRSQDATVARLLGAGADDVVVKPFPGVHLLERVVALLRRTRTTAKEHRTADDGRTLEVGDLRIDEGRRTAHLAARELALTRMEFELLCHLARNQGRVISKQSLLDLVWGGGSTSTINVHLSWLRRKLGESPARPAYLHTVRGVGLKLVAPRQGSAHTAQTFPPAHLQSPPGHHR